MSDPKIPAPPERKRPAPHVQNAIQACFAAGHQASNRASKAPSHETPGLRSNAVHVSRAVEACLGARAQAPVTLQSKLRAPALPSPPPSRIVVQKMESVAVKNTVEEKEKRQGNPEESGGGRVLRKRKKLLIDPLILGMTVKWGKHPSVGLKRVQLRLEITVELSKGPEYKYDNVRYRQQAYDYTHIRSGTHSGHEDETEWSVPEPYSPDWDERGIPGTLFFVDQPGYTEGKGIAEDDDIYYIFGAKWAVWVEGTD